MQYTPRTISFLAELLHPPMPADPAPIQRIHNQLFQSGQPAYASFAVRADGATLSNPAPQPGADSSVTFLADRIQFREEQSGLSLDEFIQRLEHLVELVIREKGVQLFTGQAITVRSLINPRNFSDSRSFLKDGVCGLSDSLARFGREPQLFGMRLVFPPTQEQPQAYALRIESFANDPRSVFIENQGTFGPSVLPGAPQEIGSRIRATYEFLTERSLSFLEQFDQRTSAQ